MSRYCHRKHRTKHRKNLLNIIQTNSNNRDLEDFPNKISNIKLSINRLKDIINDKEIRIRRLSGKLEIVIILSPPERNQTRTVINTMYVRETN